MHLENMEGSSNDLPAKQKEGNIAKTAEQQHVEKTKDSTHESPGKQKKNHNAKVGKKQHGAKEENSTNGSPGEQEHQAAETAENQVHVRNVMYKVM